MEKYSPLLQVRGLPQWFKTKAATGEEQVGKQIMSIRTIEILMRASLAFAARRPS
jgi:hypothetical protein